MEEQEENVIEFQKARYLKISTTQVYAYKSYGCTTTVFTKTISNPKLVQIYHLAEESASIFCEVSSTNFVTANVRVRATPSDISNRITSQIP